MSDVIKILPDHIANQIAAGEVIQRPASVVKELMENALDAGATQIDLVVKDAGKTLIQVIDNGKGISENDVYLAFERHATSKISNADDLYSLHTKGFRGEALASIAAIAHVELKTKQNHKDLGSHAFVEGSVIKSVEPTSCASGSSLAVKNLFFNVPARRNFLKSDAVESKHVLEEFYRLVLTHEDIGFSYTHNGNEVYRLAPAQNLRKRIVDVFGKSFNDKLVPIQETTDIVALRGFVLKPEFSKKSMGEQYFFVNNRYFKDRYFHHAVKTAFDNLIPKDHQVSYFIYMDINPAMIDVNVHPTKTEIKFEEDRSIYSILRSTVRQALGKFNLSPSLDFEQEMAFPFEQPKNDTAIVEPKIRVNPNYNPFDPSTFSQPKSHSPASSMKPDRQAWEDLYQVVEKVEPEEQHGLIFKPTEVSEDRGTAVVLQLQNRYGLSRSKNGCMLIDLKRAHSRILYDQLIQSFMAEPLGSQQLLFPIELDLSPKERTILQDIERKLTRLGFQYEIEGDQARFFGAPIQIGTDRIEKFIQDIIHTFESRDVDVGEVLHELVNSLSNQICFQGDRAMSQEELNQMIQDLFSCSEHSFDPKGRKIIKLIELKELIHDF